VNGIEELSAGRDRSCEMARPVGRMDERMLDEWMGRWLVR
jgi:hypothetical protein